MFIVIILIYSRYVGTDFLFYCLSPPLLILLLTKPETVKKIMNILIALCVCIRMWLIMNQAYPPTQLFFFQPAQYTASRNDFFHSVYTCVHTRMSTYIIGLLLGYDLATNTEPKYAKYKYLPMFLTFLFSFFGLYPCNFDNHSYSLKIYTVIFGGLQRTIFGYNISYLIYHLHKSNVNDRINAFFDSKVIAVLANLSYGAYLVHLGAFIFSFIYTKYPHHYYNLLIHILKALVLSVIPFLVSLLFIAIPIEFPFINLTRFII